MLRLPATGIDISRDDLNFHLQQLDIYQGLLKQGFKKREIVRYFKNKEIEKDTSQVSERQAVSPTALTYDLCKNGSPIAEPAKTSISMLQGVSDHSASDSEKLFPSPEQLLIIAKESIAARSNIDDQPQDRSHTPRQSSLLRFARAVSSGSSTDDGKAVVIPFSPRSNMTYRPRSATYSYDQSELDEEELHNLVQAPLSKFEHLSLDDELVPTSAESTRTTVQIVSELRPEAETFTPLYLQSTKGKGKGDGSSSITKSIPSSPPVFGVVAAHQSELSSPTLPPVHQTPPTRHKAGPDTARQRLHQQYLDGSFTVYDDEVPARLQPQTPVDLHQGPYFNEHNAAYTAPPGMVRSPAITSDRRVYNSRRPSGEISPTTRAMIVRERRQREFARSARVEGLRIARTRNGGAGEQEYGARIVNNAITGLWRDDLDADGVGEENFDDGTATAAFRQMRAISGNRRID